MVLDIYTIVITIYNYGMPYKDIQKRREAEKRYYYKNLDLYKNKNINRKKMLLEFVNSLKDKPCMDCGGTYPTFVMDFDHRDRKQKVSTISRVIRDMWSKERILSEIKKCDLVCANCHRIRTYKKSE